MVRASKIIVVSDPNGELISFVSKVKLLGDSVSVLTTNRDESLLEANGIHFISWKFRKPVYADVFPKYILTFAPTLFESEHSLAMLSSCSDIEVDYIQEHLGSVKNKGDTIFYTSKGLVCGVYAKGETLSKIMSINSKKSLSKPFKLRSI